MMIVAGLVFAAIGASCKENCGFNCSGWKGYFPNCDYYYSWPVDSTYTKKTNYPLVYGYLHETALCDGRSRVNPNTATTFYISSSCIRPRNETVLDLSPQTLLLHTQDFLLQGPATLRGRCPLFTIQATDSNSIMFKDITFNCLSGENPIVFDNSDDSTIIITNINLSGMTQGVSIVNSRRCNVKITDITSDRQPSSILKITDSTISIDAECNSLQFASIYTKLGIVPIFTPPSNCTIKSFNRDVTPIKVRYADVDGSVYGLLVVVAVYLYQQNG